ncbi:MAG TPA: SRPBCC domain-containing protein [Pyrinomonadaceae bacterium]
MYTVVAQRQIPEPVEKVWEYLTKPECLAKWFADTSYFGPDAPVRMEVGDGDFFAGRVIEWDPGIIAGVRWQFDGCGPEYEVRFSMLRRKQGTELTVQDRGALSVEEAECLRVGWSEFLMRFEKSLVKNVNTRFNWRKEIMFTIRVTEGKLEDLVAALSDPLWYKSALDGVSAEIDEAREGLIRTTIKKENWGESPTHLRVKFKSVRGVNYAYFTHEGWPELPGLLGEAERRRFVSVWLEALADFSNDLASAPVQMRMRA